MMIDKIGIVGLGLIGGSLAKALKKNKICSSIIALDNNIESSNQALKEGIIDSYISEPSDAFYTCNIIFFCMPVKKNIEFIKKIKNFVSKDCILTDVGSTKNDIITEINQLQLPCTFIGGHPMTGSEKSGYNSSQAHLFENAFYILCPLQNTPLNQLNLLKNIIEKLGALTIILEAETHDYITAIISHVPHIIAASLVNLVKDLNSQNKYIHQLAAGGFKSLTRIASSSPIMWQNICLSNKQKIIDVLEKYQCQIEIFKKFLINNDTQELYNYFKYSKEYRDSFKEINLKTFIKTYEIAVDVEDKPGIIAEIALILSNNNINIKNIGIINNREHDSGILSICFYDKKSVDESIKLLKNLNYTVYIKQ